MWDVSATEVFGAYKVIIRPFSGLEHLLMDFSTDVDYRRVGILAFGSTNTNVVFGILLACLQPETSVEADHRRCYMPSLMHLHRLFLCHSILMYTSSKELEPGDNAWTLCENKSSFIFFWCYQRCQRYLRASSLDSRNLDSQNEVATKFEAQSRAQLFKEFGLACTGKRGQV